MKTALSHRTLPSIPFLFAFVYFFLFAFYSNWEFVYSLNHNFSSFTLEIFTWFLSQFGCQLGPRIFIIVMILIFQIFFLSFLFIKKTEKKTFFCAAFFFIKNKNFFNHLSAHHSDDYAHKKLFYSNETNFED